MKKRGRGRPTKLTKELTKELVMHLENGVTPMTAIEIVGLAQSCYYDYKAHGEKDIKAGIKSDFSDFSDAIKKARANAIARALVNIQKAGLSGKSWQALAWYLERTCPEQFALRQRTDITVERKNEDEGVKQFVIEPTKVREVIEILRDAGILEEVLKQKPYGKLAREANRIALEDANANSKSVVVKTPDNGQANSNAVR